MFLYYKKVMNLIELPQKFAELAKPDLAKKNLILFSNEREVAANEF